VNRSEGGGGAKPARKRGFRGGRRVATIGQEPRPYQKGGSASGGPTEGREKVNLHRGSVGRQEERRDVNLGGRGGNARKPQRKGRRKKILPWRGGGRTGQHDEEVRAFPSEEKIFSQWKKKGDEERKKKSMRTWGLLQRNSLKRLILRGTKENEPRRCLSLGESWACYPKKQPLEPLRGGRGKKGDCQGPELNPRKKKEDEF